MLKMFFTGSKKSLIFLYTYVFERLRSLSSCRNFLKWQMKLPGVHFLTKFWDHLRMENAVTTDNMY